MALVAASAYDAAHAHPDAATRKQNQAFYEFLVPLVKGLSTEMSLDVASLGVQVHGGMGFIEETGAAQYLRDAKILTIYEGTTAIQANDLVGRKTGVTAARWPRPSPRRSSHRGKAPAGAQAARAGHAPWRLASARAPGFPRRGGLRRSGQSRPAQCGLRRQRSLPDAGRHRWSAAGRWAVRLLVAEDRLAGGNDPAFMPAKVATAASSVTTCWSRRRAWDSHRRRRRCRHRA